MKRRQQKQKQQPLQVRSRSALSDTKLLQLKPEVLRDRQQVIMFTENDDPASLIGMPYDCIAVGTKAAIKCNTHCVAVYLPSCQPETAASLPDELLKGVEDEFTSGNCINVSSPNFETSFSHCAPVDADDTIPIGVQRLASVLRYKKVGRLGAAIPKFHIVLQLWKPKQPRRWKELCTCIALNAQNPYVSSIHVLLETPECASGLPMSQKIVTVPWSKRLTYEDAFNYMGSKFAPEDLVCLANTDIFFGPELREMWHIDMKNRCVALLRYDVTMDWCKGQMDSWAFTNGVETVRVDGCPEPVPFGPRDDSQDCWIFRSGDLAARPAAEWKPLNFSLGRAGCDNAIAGELVRRSWVICNPCMTVKSYHLHESPERSYHPDDRISLGIYATIAPAGLMESGLIRSSNLAGKSVKMPITRVASVEKWLGATDKGPYERGLAAIQRGTTANTISVGKAVDPTQESIRIVSVEPRTIITGDGLIVTSTGIGFGQQEASELLWSQTDFSSISATELVDTTVFWPSEAANNYADHLWQAGRLLCLGTKPVIVGVPAILKSLFAFMGIRIAAGPALTVRDGAQGLLPDQINDLVMTPVVEKLRATFKPLLEDIEGSGDWTIMDCTDDTVDYIDGLPNIVTSTMSPIKVLRHLKTSSVLVGPGLMCKGYLWALAEGSLFIDIAPSLDAARMATAAGIKYMPMIFDADMNTKECARIIMKAASTGDTSKYQGLRKLFVPVAREGFHGHTGDSFRELAELWAEAGYVERIYHDGVFCWLDAVGAEGTLLYDRDTTEWLNDTVPEVERKWSRMLCGNELAEGTFFGSTPAGVKGLGLSEAPLRWLYWARRPRLLEEMQKRVLDRPRGKVLRQQKIAKPTVVFYGKIENSRQFKNRAVKATGKDWSTVCDEFEMPVGGKYKFTQAEYLDKLLVSCYGLCLPGYGPKCHREIECMGLGVVPIVTPGIDMNNYAVRPREGVHYLRAETPEEARRLVDETSADQWLKMSIACEQYYKDNCSVKGSWALTQRLAPGTN